MQTNGKWRALSLLAIEDWAKPQRANTIAYLTILESGTHTVQGTSFLTKKDYFELNQLFAYCMQRIVIRIK